MKLFRGATLREESPRRGGGTVPLKWMLARWIVSPWILASSAGVGGLALFSGCNVGPNYAPPVAHMPDKFSETIPGMPTVKWWQTFKDPQLDDLIVRALKQILDVRAATARLRQARAHFKPANDAAWPCYSSRASTALARRRGRG